MRAFLFLLFLLSGGYGIHWLENHFEQKRYYSLKYRAVPVLNDDSGRYYSGQLVSLKTVTEQRISGQLSGSSLHILGMGGGDIKGNFSSEQKQTVLFYVKCGGRTFLVKEDYNNIVFEDSKGNELSRKELYKLVETVRVKTGEVLKSSEYELNDWTGKPPPESVHYKTNYWLIKLPTSEINEYIKFYN